MASAQTQPNDADADRYASGATIEVAQVERELQKLWKDAAETSTSSGAGPVVRACTMNLVAPCTNDLQFQHVANAMEKVATHHPCRSILVRIDLDGTTPQIQAQASTVCSLGGQSQKRVCHEQIQLFASGASLGSLAPAVLSLFVPDVPAYVWAPCEKLLAGAVVEELAEYADALILDTHKYSDPFAALERALSIARGHRATRALEGGGRAPEAGPGFGVLDLEWIRLQRWFDATAAAFDHEDARKLVSGLQTLRIEYVVRAGDGVRSARELITPALYAGWFASRAGWTHTGQAARVAGDSLDLRLGKQGQKRVSVVPKVGNDRPGSLLELEIGGTLGRVRLRREPGSDFCATTVELNRAPQSNDRPERASRVAAGGDVEVLAQALATAPRDLPFDRAVPVALAFEPR